MVRNVLYGGNIFIGEAETYMGTLDYVWNCFVNLKAY